MDGRKETLSQKQEEFSAGFLSLPPLWDRSKGRGHIFFHLSAIYNSNQEMMPGDGMRNNLAKMVASQPSTSPPGFSFPPGICLVCSTLHTSPEVLSLPPTPSWVCHSWSFLSPLLGVTAVSALQMSHILVILPLPFLKRCFSYVLISLSPLSRIIVLRQGKGECGLEL